MSSSQRIQRHFVALIGASLFACGGTGAIEIETWGEAYIEDGIPADEFADGWSVRFSKFVIALGDVVIADRDGNEAARLAEIRVFDMVKPGPHAIATVQEVDAQRWDSVGLRHSRARSAQSGHAVLEAEDLTRMNDEGLSLLVAGVAETGTITKSFNWAFTRATAFEDCETEADGLGLVVGSGASVTLQFTIHGDHLFYDSLDGDAALRFAAMAEADEDRDGAVTLAELAAVDLTTLPPDQYGTSGAGSIVNLREFVETQSSSLVHFQGEGHCHAHPE